MTTTTTSAGLARFRLILWVLVAVAAIGATVLFLLRPAGVPLAVTGVPFSLQSTEGGTFTERSLVGTPSLVFFGFTHCPDVCPTTLVESLAWKTQLGISSDALRTIFITVDPERDTLPVLEQYLGSFDPGIVGLVGDQSQTQAAMAAFGAAAEYTEPDEYGFYLVNHTASMFLIDANGHFQGTIGYGESMDMAVGKIRRLLGHT